MELAKLLRANSGQLDDSLLAASEYKTTVDDKTILNTPIPISASTLRQPHQENSLNLSDSSSLKVSQLASSTFSNTSVERSFPPRHLVTDENQPPDFSARESLGSNGTMSSSRTSWGLVPEECIAELSNNELLPLMSSRVGSCAASQANMRTVDRVQSHGLSVPSKSSVVSSGASTFCEVIVHKSQTARVESSFMSTSNERPQRHQDACSAGRTGGVMAVLSAMLGSSGTGQGDSEFEDSVHEIVLNDSDIKQFEDEFSDLETTMEFEDDERHCEGDSEFSSSHWNFLEEKFQLTDQHLEPIDEEPNESHAFDFDTSEIGECERHDRLASLYFRQTTSLVNDAEGEDSLAEDCHRTSSVASPFQLNGSPDFFQLSVEDKQRYETEEIETARQDTLQTDTLMGDGDAGSQSYQSLFQIVQQHIARNSLSQSGDMLRPSVTSEDSSIDVTLLRSSDSNDNTSDVTMKDVTSEDLCNETNIQDENKENAELFKSRFSEVYDLAGGDGFLTLGKFSDTRAGGRPKEQRGSGQDETFPVSTSKHSSTDDESPVYINEEGEWVTYLAYSHPLGNPFEDSLVELGAGANLASFSNLEGINPAEVFGSEGEFKSGESCLDMLDMAEKKFEEENKFIQDAMVVPSSTANDTRESWTFQSHLSHLYDTSDHVDEMEPYMRISIGTFIGLRTEALGSLDGCTDNRPTFGTKFTTPPANRKPVALLDGNVSSSDGAQEEVVEEATKSVGTNMSGAATVCSDVDDTLTASALVSLGESGYVKPVSAGTSNGNQTPADRLSSTVSQSLSLSELSLTTSACEKHCQFSEMDFSDLVTDPSSVKTNSESSGLTESVTTKSAAALCRSSYDASLSKSVNKLKPGVINSAALLNSQLVAASKLPTSLASADTKKLSIINTQADMDNTKPRSSVCLKTVMSETLPDLDIGTKCENSKASISKASSSLEPSTRPNTEAIKPTISKTLSGSGLGRNLDSLESLEIVNTKSSSKKSTKSLALGSCKPASGLQGKQELTLGASARSSKSCAAVGSLKTGSTVSSNKKTISASASNTRKQQDSKPDSSGAPSKTSEPSHSGDTSKIRRSSAMIQWSSKTDGASKGQALSNLTQSLPVGVHSVSNAVGNSAVENLTVTSGNEMDLSSRYASVPGNTYCYSDDMLETKLLNSSSQTADRSLSYSTAEMASKSRFSSHGIVETSLSSYSNKIPTPSFSKGRLKSGTTLTETDVQVASSKLMHPEVQSEGYVGVTVKVATKERSRDSRQKSLEGSWDSSGDVSKSGSLEQTTVLNITEIARKISMSSESDNPEDLANLIAVMSNSKWNGKSSSEHDARNEVSSDLRKSKNLEVTKSALVSNAVIGIDDSSREKVVLGEGNAAKKNVSSGMANKTDAVNAVEISTNASGPNLCSIMSELPSSKETAFKLPEGSVVQKQKSSLVQENAKKPRTEENFHFRSPRPSSVFARSKRQELEQSVLVNSYIPAEVSFCAHPPLVNETNQPTECLMNTAGSKLSAPIDMWNSIDISADLGQTVKLAPSVIRSIVPTVNKVDSKRNSMSKVARSFSYQQAIAPGNMFDKGNNRTGVNVTSGGSTAEAQNSTVTADGTGQRKVQDVSPVNTSLLALPPQSSQPQNSGVLASLPKSLISTKNPMLNVAGAKLARLSTGLMGDSIFDASRMLPIPEAENALQLSQYPATATKPGPRYATNVSLMTSAISMPGIDNSLAIDPFSQSTPMVKSSIQPNTYEPMYNATDYQSGMNQMVAKQRVDPVRLDLPSELSFQEVCCVGLTVHDTLRVSNPSPYWVHTHFCMVSLSVDCQALDPFSVVPFIVKQRLMLQPFGSEDVKVLFAPRHPGSYVAHLTLLVDQPQHASNIPIAIALRAVAEKPCIQIITPVAESLLDFGALPWGSHKVMPLMVVNKGRAMVPVRLFISSPKSSSCCFSFAYYDGDLTNANMNVSAQCSCILRGIDASAKEFPVTLMVVFRAPTQQSARGLIPVQEALGFIALEIDLPSIVIPLGSVRLKGLSGTARLHAPEQMDTLVLKAEIGTGPQMQVVPLRNAGNIPLDVSLEMAHWTDLFTVTPMQVMIEPGGQSEVCVRFEPTPAAAKGVKFDSLLFMIIEPDGPAYEIPVTGEILLKVSSRDLSKLLSNRSFVAWGGMPIGKTGKQMVTLKNNSNQLLKLLLEIHGSPEFKFMMNYGRKEKTTTSREIIVKSSEEFPISLAFTPTGVRGSSAKLHIRHAGTSIKYSLPLSGYGGQSQVVPDNLPLQPEGYYLSTANYTGNREAVLMVTLRNIGTRAAFINGQSFQDLTSSVAQPPGKVIMEPNEFCLPVNEKQDVAIIIRLTDKDLSYCWEKSSTSFVAILSFYYGDEISRQLCRRSLSHGNRPSQDCVLPSNNPLSKIRFDVHYRSEDLISEGQDIWETADDFALFFKNMSRVTLAVGLSLQGQCAGNLQPLIPDATSGFAVTTFALQRQTTESSHALELSAEERTLPRSDSPPVRDPPQSVVLVATKKSINSEEKLEVIEPTAVRRSEPLTSDLPWRIEPEELCIACASGDQRPEVKHLHIVNNRDSTIKFDVSWPAHCLCITPEHGTVSPKSSLQLCVNTSDGLKKRGIALPWNGMLHITCEGQVKVVRVQVVEVTENCSVATGVKAVQAPAVSTADSLQPGDQQVVVTVTYPSVLEGESGCGRMAKQSLCFPTTPVGQAQDLPLDILNASTHRVNWVVSGFTPPYLKPVANAQGTDKDQYRILYTVYSMHQSIGTLEPGQKTRVGVRFRPRQSGTYSQYYDVKFERVEVHEESYTCKLELYGESTKDESLGASNSTLGLQGISAVTVSKVSSLSSNSITSDITKESSSGSKLRSSEGWLISRPKAVEFPKSSNHEPCVQKVELKNASSTDHRIDILSPIPPFVVNHSQIVIKSRHFLRLPVEFRPTKPGHYHSVLVLKADTGETFMIQLWAESA